MPTLDFKGKQFVHTHHLTVPIRTLKLDAKKSFPAKGGASLNDNLIIHGDNLHALKALMPRYAGKVNCIYIDPPYNTGNEGWIYNDNVNSPMMKEWLKGKSPVDGEDLERHDKWLCMMWPRLCLLQELLAEEGTICISCDDNELANLILILDEIFGENNREEVIAWRRRHNQPNDKSKPIAKTAEFILVYSKNLKLLKEKKAFHGLPLTGKFSNPDNDPRGAWGSKPWKSGSSQTGARYKITTPKGKVYDEEWLGTERTFKSLLKGGRIFFPNGGQGLPRKKYYESERAEEGQCAHNFWGHDEFGSNQEASSEINQIGVTFDNPKPSRLVKSILQIFSNEESIVLDSFAGSGTTAHAVLSLNKEDGGNRKFILVECENRIANKITAERVRRVIKGVPKAKDERLKKGLGGGFSYCTLGDEISAEKMLTGKKLPDYETLARHLIYVATGQSPDKLRKQRGEDGFFYETTDRLFYLIYEPKLVFLQSSDSALNSERVERIHKKLREKKKTQLSLPRINLWGKKN